MMVACVYNRSQHGLVNQGSNQEGFISFVLPFTHTAYKQSPNEFHEV